MRPIATSAFAITALLASGAAAADVELWRLDCGEIEVRDLSLFSDTYKYSGEKRTLTDSCYLIRHDKDYMLWDTGLPAALIGAKADPKAVLAPTLAEDIPTQLAKIGVKPEQIGRLGISHNHFDHVGQAASFPGATLMIKRCRSRPVQERSAALRRRSGLHQAMARRRLESRSHFGRSRCLRRWRGDDPFHARPYAGRNQPAGAAERTGPVLLSGDVAHFEEQFANRGVPSFNYDRSETLASMERITSIAKELKATLIVQHDASDIKRLPAFPKSAR